MSLAEKRIFILTTHEFEDTELTYPQIRLKEECADVKIVAPKKETLRGKHGQLIEPHMNLEEALTKPLPDCLIIPGGYAPDKLRTNGKALELVRKIYKNDKIIAAICHGPQVLISAGILEGKHVTCYKAIKDDVINAGAIYADKSVIKDENIITSRHLGDLPNFCEEIIKALSK